MTDYQQPKLTSEILGVLKDIQSSLKAIAIVQVASEFYTLEERRELFGELDVLREKYRAANTVLSEARKAMPDPALSWNERLEKYGDATTKQQSSYPNECADQLGEVFKELESFSRKHALLLQLWDSASDLGKKP